MALIQCPECGKEISTSATQCINCGYRIKNSNKKASKIMFASIIAIIGILLLTVGIVTIGGSNFCFDYPYPIPSLWKFKYTNGFFVWGVIWIILSILAFLISGKLLSRVNKNALWVSYCVMGATVIFSLYYIFVMNDGLATDEEVLNYSEEKENIETLRYIQDQAYKGDAEAQFYMGIAFMGKGYDFVPVNYYEALAWFKKAANNGYREAFYNVGYFYQNGIGVEPNITEAIEYFQKGAELGDPYAMNALGVQFLKEGSPQALAQGNELIQKAANQGFAPAEYNLGMSYVNGSGITQNINEGFRLIEKSAKQGYALAQFQLGFFYLEGIGVSPNREEAVKWFDKAEEQNSLEANLLLIKLYLDENYDFDNQKGIQLLKEMAESGYSVYAEFAQEKLKELDVK